MLSRSPVQPPGYSGESSGSHSHGPRARGTTMIGAGCATFSTLLNRSETSRDHRQPHAEHSYRITILIEFPVRKYSNRSRAHPRNARQRAGRRCLRSCGFRGWGDCSMRLSHTPRNLRSPRLRPLRARSSRGAAPYVHARPCDHTRSGCQRRSARHRSDRCQRIEIPFFSFSTLLAGQERRRMIPLSDDGGTTVIAPAGSWCPLCVAAQSCTPYSHVTSTQLCAALSRRKNAPQVHPAGHPFLYRR